MDILTGKCSDRFMAHVLKRRDQEAVRWYVLTLPTAGGGRDKISPSKGLDAELSRRERRGETLFEYFAPSYVEARKVGGKMVNT
ncbi:transcriptional regulator, partial [Parabacteroides sp. OF04-13BH]